MFIRDLGLCGAGERIRWCVVDVLISSGLKSLSVPVGKVFWEVEKHTNCAGDRRPVIAFVT